VTTRKHELTAYPTGTAPDDDWGFWRYNPDWTMAHTKFKMLECPSDNVYEQLRDDPGTPTPTEGAVVVMTHSFDNVMYTGWLTQGGVPYQQQGRSNYTGVGGANGCSAPSTSSSADGPGANLRIYEGIFCNRSQTSLGGIQDGTSNTLMFGEGIGGKTIINGNPGQPGRDFAWSWMGVGYRTTKFGLGIGGQVGEPSNSTTKGAHTVRFSSWHPSGVQFCFADGSVRTVRFGATCQRNPASSDWYLLQQLAGKSDGKADNTSAILD
jgi:prepilin-type processing-associated H-X9-DG protein